MDIQKRIETWLGRYNRAEQADALCMFGSQLLADGDVDDALACFDRALQLSAQNSARAWVGRGEVLAQKNRAGEALGCAERALARDPSLISALLLKASVLLKVGSRREALDCYDAAILATPDAAELWLDRARVLDEMKREAEAVISLDRALAISDAASTWVMRGDVLTKVKRDADAAKSYARAAVLEPDNAETMHRLAIARSKAGDIAGTSAAVARFADLAPSDPRVATARSTLEQLERYSGPAANKEAGAGAASPAAAPQQRPRMAIANRASRRPQQRRPSSRAMRGVGKRELSDISKTRSSPGDSEGDSSAENGNLANEDRAADPSSAPRDARAQVLGLPEAQAFFALGRNIEALRVVERLVTESPKDVLVWILRARILQSLGKLDVAATSLEQATRIDSDNAEAWKLTARCNLERKKYDRALDAIERAYGVRPSDPEVHRLRGDCLVASDRHLEAIYAYEKAVHYAPKDAHAWLALGRVLRLVRRPVPAREALEKACGLAESANKPALEAEARELLRRLG